jgi:hypothetical protein
LIAAVALAVGFLLGFVVAVVAAGSGWLGLGLGLSYPGGDGSGGSSGCGEVDMGQKLDKSTDRTESITGGGGLGLVAAAEFGGWEEGLGRIVMLNGTFCACTFSSLEGLGCCQLGSALSPLTPFAAAAGSPWLACLERDGGRRTIA